MGTTPLRRSDFPDLKLICPNGCSSGCIFHNQTMLRTMQDHTRLRQRRNWFITVVLIIALIVIIWAGATVVNQGDTPTRFAKQFTGRDVYAPDVHPNPVGSGYIMWYAGWQSQQTLDSGQLDTIYRRTAPTSDGPWSSPTTVLVASQVAPQVTEVNDPSVSIIAAGSSLRYAMFFTTLVCHPDAPGCATTQQQSASSQVWSATSDNGVSWGSFKRMAVSDPGQKGVSGPSAVLQPSGPQQWLVFFGTGCLIGMASVSAGRDVLGSSIAYRGTGDRCMSNPVVFKSGTTWHMLFNVLEPTSADAVRFDVWKTSSASLTNWLLASASPIVVVNGGRECGVLTPDVVPHGSTHADLYVGLVAPGSSGACDDLTQSTAIARMELPASML